MGTLAHGTGWRRATACSSASCVEVARIDDEIAVRDSKTPDSPQLKYTREEWKAFLNGVKAGEFDDLAESA